VGATPTGESMLEQISRLLIRARDLRVTSSTMLQRLESLQSELKALKEGNGAAPRTSAYSRGNAMELEKLLSEQHSIMVLKDDVILGKDQIIAEKDDALEKKDREIAVLRKSLSDVRQRYHSLPNTPVVLDRLTRIGEWLRIKSAPQFQKIRLGRANDGGYICLKDFVGVTAAISLGINDDVSWDKDIADLGIKVFQYDHTISDLPLNHENFAFFKKMVSNVESEDTETLSSLLSKNGLTSPLSVIAKIDIEGDEWDVLDAASEETLSAFSQIICEFHFLEKLTNELFFDKVSRVYEKLVPLFAPIHVHANNCCPLLVIGNKLLPSVFEVTFANRAKYSFEESREVFPGSLDAPNLTERADHPIGRFEY
jgi:hypothetical protein